MERIFISFCEESGSRAANRDVRSGTIEINFDEELLFFCDDPLPAAANRPHSRSAWICCGHPVLRLLAQKLAAWMEKGTKANISKHFNSRAAYDRWRRSVGFSDEEILWHIYKISEDGLDVELSFGSALPRELEEIYDLTRALRELQ